MNGGSTQEQYLYCDSAHPHQLSNLSQSASTPTCSSKGTVDYTGGYDSWGNTTSQVRSGSTRTLSYDGQDHLVRWSSSVNNQEEWNLYDASGERVLRRTYDGTNTVLTVFAFGEEEHAYSYSGSGSGDTNTSNTSYYTLGGQTLGTWDGTSPNTPTTNFLLTDTLGSVVSSFNNLPNGAAMVLGDQVYGPYGNQRVKQGTISTSKGFTGQFTDSVAGLDYCGARFYDPVSGQFLSADVVEGNGVGMNPYGYVGGNPESYNDPNGQYRIGLGGLTCAFSGCVESQIPIVNDNLGPKENPNPLGNDVRGPVINDGLLNDLRGPVIKDSLLNDLPGMTRDTTNIAQEWAKAQAAWNDLAQSVRRILDQAIFASSGESNQGEQEKPKEEPKEKNPGDRHTKGSTNGRSYEDRVKAEVGDPTVGEPNSHKWDGSMPATDALHNPIPKSWDGPDAIEMWGTPDERWIEAKQVEPEEMLFQKDKNVRQIEMYQYFGRPFTYYMNNMPDQSTLDFITQAGGDYVIFP